MDHLLKLIKKYRRGKRVSNGVSVIEVLIALGVGVVVIAAVGNLISATHRLTSSSGKEVQAVNFARQWIDVMASQANNKFGCSCGATNPCAGTPPSCTTGSGATQQSCSPRSGFNSCWVSIAKATPPTLTCTSPNAYKLTWATATSTWDVVCANPIPTSDTDFHPLTGFTRTITFTNLQRDATGALVSSGGTVDPNTKQVTVTVTWPFNTTTRQKQVSTILTAWKNF